MAKFSPSDIFDRMDSQLPSEVRSTVQQFRGRACAQQYRLPYALTQRYLPTPATALDWGCGNGHFSFFLREAGHEVDGYAFGKPSPLARYLHTEVGALFRYTAGSSVEPILIPYADQTFDVVISVGVVEHVREFGGEEAKCLAEIYRIVKPGGLFLCFHLPNRYSWIEVLTSVFRFRFHHSHKYAEADILQLMETAGFTIEHLSRYNALPRNIFSSLPFFRRSHWLTRGVDALDTLLCVVLDRFCQNYAVVARRAERHPLTAVSVLPLTQPPSGPPSVPK